MSELPPTNTTASAPSACRVCGEAFKKGADCCSRCGTSRTGRARDPNAASLVDVLLAIALGITVLVITLPTTLSLMKHLWPPFGQEAFAAAMAISVLNGIALGVPLAVTIWRWRERIAEGHRDSTLIPRDYWQVQAYVLFPVLLCSWLFLSFYSLLTMRCFGGPPM